MCSDAELLLEAAEDSELMSQKDWLDAVRSPEHKGQSEVTMAVLLLTAAGKGSLGNTYSRGCQQITTLPIKQQGFWYLWCTINFS